MNEQRVYESFLPAPRPGPAKRPKQGQRVVVIVVAVLVVLATLGAVAGVLYWYFTDSSNGKAAGQRSVNAVRVYSGHLSLSNIRYVEQFEDPESTEFKNLAEKLEKVINSSCNAAPDLSPYFVESRVFDYSDSTNLMAYYFARFEVPPQDADALPKFSEDALIASLRGTIRDSSRSFGLDDFTITSVSSSLANPHLVMSPEDRDCHFTFHAKDTDYKFNSPGFNTVGYPNNLHCQWVLRAAQGHVIYLEFLDFNTDDDCGNDFIVVHDSLSPAEDDVITKKCGKRPSSNHLVVTSSGSVMLVTMLTDGNERYKGFSAVFSERPKLRECGGTLNDLAGNFSTPYYPAFYPPNIDCTWKIKVPSHLKIRIKFDMVRMEEPGVRNGECNKDYLELEGERYCGDHSIIGLQIDRPEAEVKFHSDESHTDKGFMGQYTAYDPENPCPGEYTCRTGLCISTSLHCDGWNDCGDLSDELNCDCDPDQFTCANGICKPRLWLCDRVNDCGDNSDEKACECSGDDWKCHSGACIPKYRRCDEQMDCVDGSDEVLCPNSHNMCTEITFKCADGSCVNKVNAECDGQQDCEDGSDESGCVPQCGMRPYEQNRIVGGSDANVGEWPWQVSLHYGTLGHTCGASIISDRWLVSASHCFMDQYDDATKWSAYSGLNFQGDTTAQLRGLRQIIKHERYNADTFDYDIALLELDTLYELRPKVHPICLPDVTHIFPTGKACWVTGWGAMYEGGSGSISLQKAEVKMINDTICNVVTEGQVTSRMLCSGYLAGAIDACQGDSGGPLSCREENGKWFLAGIVSWGEGCARRNKPGIYSRVTKLRDWIREKTNL